MTMFVKMHTDMWRCLKKCILIYDDVCQNAYWYMTMFVKMRTDIWRCLSKCIWRCLQNAYWYMTVFARPEAILRGWQDAKIQLLANHTQPHVPWPNSPLYTYIPSPQPKPQQRRKTPWFSWDTFPARRDVPYTSPTARAATCVWFHFSLETPNHKAPEATTRNYTWMDNI